MKRSRSGRRQLSFLALLLLATAAPLPAQLPRADAGIATSAAPPPTAFVPGEALQALIVEAVATHPSIGAANATVRASGADLRAARWQSFPSFTLEGMLLSEAGNNRQASLMVEQPIWAAGRIAGSIRRARADREAAIAGYQEAVLQIMLDVSQSWHDYHRLDRRHAVLSHSLSEHRALVETMRRRVAQEVSPLADLELAQSRTAQIEQQVATTAAQRSTSLQGVRELVGDPGFTPGPPPAPGPMPATPESEGLVAQAFEFDPARQRLAAEAKSAGAQADVARASVVPQLSGQYSYNETYGHRVGLVLRAQSDGGLSRFAAASAAGERRIAADLRISAQERQLREQILSDLAEYESARQRMESTRTARSATARVTESYMRQFVSGRRSWLDVMNAVREATTAENDAIDAESSAMTTLNRLLMRSGSWPFPIGNEDLP